MEQPMNLKVWRVRPLFGFLKSFLASKGNMAATIKTMLFSILILVINMLTGVLTARYLGPTGRGEQTAMVLWSQFLAFSLTLGIPSALIYNVTKNPKDAAKLYTTALWMGLAAGAMAAGIGVLTLPVWLKSHSHGVVSFAQWSMLLVPLMVFSQINNAVMQVRGEYKQYNRLRFLVPCCTLALLIVLIAAGRMSPTTTALAYLLPSVPFYIGNTIRLLGLYKVAFQDAYASFKRLITYGMGSYGNDLMGNVSYYIDQIVIVGLLKPAELGLYAVAVSLARIVNVFSTSIIVVLFPKASGLPKEEAVALTFRVFRIGTTIALLASAIIMLIAPYVFTLFYGAEFKEALGVFRLLLLEVSISGGTMVLAQAFMALGKPKVVTILQGIGLLMVIPMLIVLVPRWGLIGAGYAMLSSVLLRFAFILLNVRYTLKMAIPSLLVTKDDIRWLYRTVKAYAARKQNVMPLG
ncbi:oligosaccharide flippase family protein [Paenibacillus cymbidii]|uniref:oligosaccharide flippase family protein n=1 Tax=Paenibacillus cymbidii TaxID=1639034 RepID=UPI001F1F4B2A|nr:oligosaccharide flippase family protein [Paenibacillus cymbidii]